MLKMLNLDTHILIHAVSNLLTNAERQLLAAEEWGISDIVLWEIEMLYERGRIGFGLDHPPLIESLRRVKIWPISPEVCLALRALDFHSNPADEIIAATSLAYDIPLVTRDARIRKSKLVRFGP
jgi:PIN domain nuclease of toxin-antitoxin system